MLKRTVVSLPLLALALAAGTGFAQGQEAPKPSEPLKFYKLEFVLKEVEGAKVLNARSYSMTAATDARGTQSIRAGIRVPYQVGNGTQYLDIGVNIDCQVIREVQGDLSLLVTADISSLPSEPAETTATRLAAPIIHQNKWSSTTIVPLKKSTLIFSSDDPTSKQQMQLELAATPIK